MIHLNRNRIKNITLWVGILTALLLIFGTFSHSIGTLGSDDVFNLVIREVGGEQIRRRELPPYFLDTPWENHNGSLKTSTTLLGPYLFIKQLAK